MHFWPESRRLTPLTWHITNSSSLSELQLHRISTITAVYDVQLRTFTSISTRDGTCTAHEARLSSSVFFLGAQRVYSVPMAPDCSANDCLRLRQKCRQPAQSMFSNWLTEKGGQHHWHHSSFFRRALRKLIPSCLTSSKRFPSSRTPRTSLMHEK